MKKAILVFELADDVNINEIEIRYLILNKYGMVIKADADGCPIKLMPEKKEVEVNEIEDIMHTEYSIEDIYTNKYIATIRLATDKLISLGWNACLDEIKGETE